MKALRLVDAGPMISDNTVSFVTNMRKKKRHWVIDLTGPDGKKYVVPFELMNYHYLRMKRPA